MGEVVKYKRYVKMTILGHLTVLFTCPPMAMANYTTAWYNKSGGYCGDQKLASTPL